MSRRSGLGRLLLFAAVGLLVWAVIVGISGGFRIDLGPLRVSSRDARRVLFLALLAFVLAWRIAYREPVRRWIGQAPRIIMRLDALLRQSAALDRIAMVLAWMLSCGVLAGGIRYGSRVAGGADAFGYMSASFLWAHGLLGLDLHTASALPWPSAAGTFVPLAYRLGNDTLMGPTVAPGLPLLMALARAFSSCGPYFVVPLCASLLVLMTFELGRRLFSAGMGLVAAALVACSPVVFFQSLVVMADVPAAAFWTSALVAALTGTPRGPLLAGALSGIAILIRPNLLPLALFPWLMSLLRRDASGSALQRTAWFALGSVPSALFIAWLNRRLYGSPFTSGYGDIGGAFAMTHATRNISMYSRWWLESQGVAAFLFLAALWRPRSAALREVVILVAYAACVVLMYLFYLPFDQWWYLRFLVPAIPVVFLLCAAAIDRATAWSPSLRAVALLTFVSIVASHALNFIASKDIMTNSTAERRRYLDAARYVDAVVPRSAIVLAMQHSGSVRYYAGRLTMRWDVLDPRALDSAVAALRAHDVPVYALLEGWEEEDFHRRFAGRHLPDPIAATADGEVRLYAVDPAPGGVRTAVMPRIEDDCVDASPDFVYPDAQRRLAAAGRSLSWGRPLER